ncbi:MAG: hypothetical protein ACP5R4_08940 [Armatimonadota bacterium]
MKEIVSEAAFTRWLGVFAVFTPAAVAAAWVGIRRLKADSKRKMFALLIGATGPFVLAVWFVYGFIVDTCGLDSVKALFINAGLFLSAGLAAGWFCGRRSKQTNVSKQKGDR